MINFIKNILPVAVMIIGTLVEFVGKIFSGIAKILYNISTTLHIVLGTKTGIQLEEIEKSVAAILKTYSAITEKVQQNRQAQSQESNKLADIIKDSPNVVKLGKKKDDDTQN